jgi:hypothetical protein
MTWLLLEGPPGSLGVYKGVGVYLVAEIAMLGT